LIRITDEQGKSFQVASDELSLFLAQLRQSETQSLDIAATESGWPVVSILRNGDWVVIHYTEAKDGSMFVLKNDTAADAPKSLEFRFAGGTTTYTQELLNPLDRLGDLLPMFETQHLLAMDDRWSEL
jgi:hypothetical protein